MKQLATITRGLLLSLAVVFAFSSCTKKEADSKVPAAKEAPAITQEQIKTKAELKKGVEESKKLVVARVNGSDITMYNLVKEMNFVASRFVPARQPATPALTVKVKKEALNNLIFKELAVQEAIKEGMRVKPNAVEDVINKVRAQVGSEEAYKKYLEERNLNENGLRKDIERSHLIEMITAKEIFDKIRVDDKVLRNNYEKDMASFMTKDNPSRQMSFEEAKGFIENKIKSEIGKKRIAEWNNKLREKAKIDLL